MSNQYGMMNANQGYCGKPHHPDDVEAHARERLVHLRARIPQLKDELAMMMIEVGRLETMLVALEPKP